MNDDIQEMKITELETSIKTLSAKIEKMPDEISAKIDTSINLKIENAAQKLKLDFYKWLVPIILSIVGTLIATVFNYIR